MSDLRDLYQEIVLDHSKSPRNERVIESADADAEGFNPLCGDRVHVYLALDGDRLEDVSFEGSGCAISKASASMMTQALKGRTRTEAEKLFAAFHRLVTGVEAAPNGEALGKLAVFAGVSEFPVRVKCASLAWHTMRAALSGQRDSVTTE
ncbi:MAG: Fe-S cluster assembly sulfur transfer protein SufU [Candidatus Eiseniibacteriota bacterium]